MDESQQQIYYGSSFVVDVDARNSNDAITNRTANDLVYIAGNPFRIDELSSSQTTFSQSVNVLVGQATRAWVQRLKSAGVDSVYGEYKVAQVTEVAPGFIRVGFSGLMTFAPTTAFYDLIRTTVNQGITGEEITMYPLYTDKTPFPVITAIHDIKTTEPKTVAAEAYNDAVQNATNAVNESAAKDNEDDINWTAIGIGAVALVAIVVIGIVIWKVK